MTNLERACEQRDDIKRPARSVGAPLRARGSCCSRAQDNEQSPEKSQKPKRRKGAGENHTQAEQRGVILDTTTCPELHFQDVARRRTASKGVVCGSNDYSWRQKNNQSSRDLVMKMKKARWSYWLQDAHYHCLANRLQKKTQVRRSWELIPHDHQHQLGAVQYPGTQLFPARDPKRCA